MSCKSCTKRTFCKQAFRIRRTCDASGRPYDSVDGCTLYDYVARAYDFSSHTYQRYRGTIRVKPETDFVKAVSASVRGKNKDAWLCLKARRIE